MNVLTLARARTIIQTAVDGPRSSGDRRIAVAVCDPGGHPLALERQHHAPPLLSTKGGVFIRDAKGEILGAVGVAGEAGEMDEKLACRGIEAAGFTPDPG